MQSEKMLIVCIVLCLTALAVKVDGDSSQDNDFNSFIGTPQDFGYLADNTNGVQLFLKNKPVDFSAFVVDEDNVALLNSMLRTRTVSDFLYVATKLTAIEAILAERAGEHVTKINFEDMFNTENDAPLSREDVDEIYDEVTGQGSSDSGHSDHSRKKRKARDTTFKWPTTIPYKIRPGDFDSNREEVVSAIDAAMQNWKDETCLNFEQVDRYVGSHLEFIKDKGCWSFVGRQRSNHSVSLGTGCERIGIVIHEIGHAIGLHHEQARPDRDRYVTINYANVKTGERKNFWIRSWNVALTHGIPYDFSSIMHYTLDAFSRNGLDTISIKEKDDSAKSLAGSRNVLSFYDAKIANYMYCEDQCPEGLDWSACQNGGYRDPKDCSTCRCPDGWSGTHCTQLEPAVNGNCGGELVPESTWATLTSPNYWTGSLTLDQHLECTWRLKTNKENVQIVTKFKNRFSLPCNRFDSPCKSYVELRNQEMTKTGQRHCCDKKPQGEIISHGKEMMILLRLDAGDRSENFQLEYKIEPCGCSADNSMPTMPACLETTTYSCPETDIKSVCWFGCRRERNNTCYKTEKKCCGDYKLNGDKCYGPLGAWSEWSTCSATCDAGTKERTRRCSSPPCSGNLKETAPCTVMACSLKGVWSSWSNFSACNSSCGPGTTSRTRTCSNPPCSGSSTEAMYCFAGNCPPVWGQWDEWRSCSRTCGTGTRTRTRSCISDHCRRGAQLDTETCNVKDCNDGWSNWFQWSGCSRTCGSGIRSRLRSCENLPCSGNKYDMDSCNEKACSDGWSNWFQWSGCSRTCGSGYRSRSRSCENPPCSGNNYDTESCNEKACTGEWSTWNVWTNCSRPCGSGYSLRWRQCSSYPCSGKFYETKVCNTNECNGEWSTWKEWSSCSQSCGSGVSSRWRTCSRHPCKVGESYETKTCNLQTCQESWGSWTAWSACSRTCGTGFHMRSRTCSNQPCVGPRFQGSFCFRASCSFTIGK